jgi:hypothetical protein
MDEVITSNNGTNFYSIQTGERKYVGDIATYEDYWGPSHVVDVFIRNGDEGGVSPDGSAKIFIALSSGDIIEIPNDITLRIRNGDFLSSEGPYERLFYSNDPIDSIEHNVWLSGGSPDVTNTIYMNMSDIAGMAYEPGTRAITLTSTAAPNNQPIANSDTVNFSNRTPDEYYALALTELLANDIDADGDALSVGAVESDSDGNGTVVLSGDQAIFTPSDSSVTEGHFSYRVDDGQGGSSWAPVAVNIQESREDADLRRLGELEQQAVAKLNTFMENFEAGLNVAYNSKRGVNPSWLGQRLT